MVLHNSLLSTESQHFLVVSFYLTANKEYYHQWSVEDCQGCSLDLSAFTIEELDNITSEYTLKNTVGLHAVAAVHQVAVSLPVETRHHGVIVSHL